jgi:hypothetical protein
MLESPGIMLKSGDLVLWNNRFAEVIWADLLSRVFRIRVIDEGGLAREFYTDHLSELRLLKGSKGSILDDLTAATRPKIGHRERLERVAEVWFADPQVGDVFTHGSGIVIKISELRADGSIIVEHQERLPGPHNWKISTRIYNDANTLRNNYMRRSRPGYWVLPVSTRRSEFQDRLRPLPAF